MFYVRGRPLKLQATLLYVSNITYFSLLLLVDHPFSCCWKSLLSGMGNNFYIYHHLVRDVQPLSILTGCTTYINVIWRLHQHYQCYLGLHQPYQCYLGLHQPYQCYLGGVTPTLSMLSEGYTNHINVIWGLHQYYQCYVGLHQYYQCYLGYTNRFNVIWGGYTNRINVIRDV